jgi:hypothetical protein
MKVSGASGTIGRPTATVNLRCREPDRWTNDDDMQRGRSQRLDPLPLI